MVGLGWGKRGGVGVGEAWWGLGWVKRGGVGVGEAWWGWGE